MTFYFLNKFAFAYGCLEQDIRQSFMFIDHVNSCFFEVYMKLELDKKNRAAQIVFLSPHEDN